MLRFLVSRIVLLVITLFAASIIVFTASEFTPGSVARKSLGPYATQEQVESLTKRLKADDPLPVRYVRWIGVLTGVLADPLQDPANGLGFSDPRGSRYFGNFGYSTLYKLPVNDVIWDRLGNTAILAGLAFAFIIPLSMIFGVLSGMREGSKLDRTLSTVSIVLTSIPEFASSVFLVTLFVILLPWLLRS